MSTSIVAPTSYRGLLPEEVLASRKTHGPNAMYFRPKRPLLRILWQVVREPMFLLLLVACVLYFVIGDRTEAWLMVGAVLFVISIEIIQDYRSERALEALRQYAQPQARVIRTGAVVTLPAEEVVVTDLLYLAEGELVAADATLVESHDFTVNEAILTGESLPVTKTKPEQVFQGATINSGWAIARVDAVGLHTQLGQLGKSIEAIDTEPTPLQRQINYFVRQMMWAGLGAFLLVWFINYGYTHSWLTALLFSLAFAMALIPEEIPVAFTTFMALGAYRLTREQVLVKQPKTVESLGSATVICLDKTGTITENRMSVAEVVPFADVPTADVLAYAMWASEPTPFDAMEQAIHAAYAQRAPTDLRPSHQLAHDYPLEGAPPMMTHMYTHNPADHYLVAGKGAIEKIAAVCHLDAAAATWAETQTQALASKGYRVLGIARAQWPLHQPMPEHQEDFNWTFLGLVGLYDPPKANIQDVIGQFYEAGVDVKMITGDYPATALNIATLSGIRPQGEVLTGDKVMALTDEDLQRLVPQTSIFARMFPSAKLRVVEALKATGAVVAMTGDGVNDGPALKAAPIGIAMGKRGTEIAKSAASMVLLDDNLAHMVQAIRAGRRIHHNLRKAIRYIVSIHLPIVLVVVAPLVFGWPYLHMLLPVHVIFLELIMDPTCAVAFENEPAEPGIMEKGPHATTDQLFSWQELSFSLLQGLVITLGVLGIYHYAIQLGADENLTRSYVFATMLASNVLLTLANRSFTQTMNQTLRYPNRLLVGIVLASVGLATLVFGVPFLRQLFHLTLLPFSEWLLCLSVAVVVVMWFEGFKAWRKYAHTHKGAQPTSATANSH